MEENLNFSKIEISIDELKKKPIEEQVDELINILNENNKATKVFYDAFIKTQNTNIKLINSLTESINKIVEKVKETEEWKVAQQSLDEKLTDRTIENANSIEGINMVINSMNGSINSISELFDVYSERFSIIQEQLDLLK